jgi:hypothetical protein
MTAGNPGANTEQLRHIDLSMPDDRKQSAPVIRRTQDALKTVETPEHTLLWPLE